jgi:hypothetical protein
MKPRKEMVVTLAELRDLPCAVCKKNACTDNFVLTANCHPDAGVKATLDRETGVLLLTCGQCDRHVVTLQLESPPKSVVFQ